MVSSDFSIEWFIRVLFEGFDLFLSLIVYAVLIVIIASWFGPRALRLSIIRYLSQAVGPLMRSIRRIIPPLGGTIDFSPIILVLGVRLLQLLLDNIEVMLLSSLST